MCRPLQPNKSLLLQMITNEIVTPEEVDLLLADIGGLESIIQRLVRIDVATISCETLSCPTIAGATRGTTCVLPARSEMIDLCHIILTLRGMHWFTFSRSVAVCTN